MPWIVGIDEAGYGPNLGPFVMSLSAMHVPAAHADADLWQLLAAAVCRMGETANGRLIVDDSKAVYVPSIGLARLEQNLLPFVCEQCASLSLSDYWNHRCLTPFDELRSEPWFEDGCTIPLGESLAIEPSRACLTRACAAAGVQLGPVFSVAVFPRQFNELVAQHDSKAAIPAWALHQLLARLPKPLDDEPTAIYVDKLGGRDYYHELMQSIFPASLVLSRGESAEWSSYRVVHDGALCHVTFTPKADARHLPVALASMASKYLREVVMEMFNRFWQRHVPELKRTAGYPTDSKRYYRDIRAARKRLRITDKVLWRVR
jgi:ribonuclease HII